MSLSSPLEIVPIYMPCAQRMANELNVVSIDHNYAKPWSTHPEASNARAARHLFMDAWPRPSNSEKVLDENEMIDVETQDKPAMPDYDVPNARTMMSECDRHAALLRPDFAETNDWEDHIAAIRTTWTVLQNRLFAKVMRVLQSDSLARLTIKESKNEPIQRRLQIDKAAKRVRFAFANANWDMPVILWLHNLFLENLRGQLLTSYLEILQTLKVKIPSLVECLIDGTVCKSGGLTMESLGVLLKRTWDPVLSSIHHQKPKKLPGQALLLVISNVPFVPTSPLAAKRHKFWYHQLAFMGKVVSVVPVNNSTAISVANCVENMVASARSKILEVKGHYPGRPIVLVGFHIGSLVACQVALMEQVQAVVCLGYPTMGVSGNRYEVDDPVYNCKTPTLFVVGQYASSCSVDDLEDIREKLRVDTGMVVVGGGDDHLRMCRSRKKSCGVTQSVVDRCVIDEMTSFLGNILQAELSSSDSMDDVDIVKKSPRKRKQKPALAVAVGSQTPGDLLKQKSAKALKSLKQDPMLSSVGGGMDGGSLMGRAPAAPPTSLQAVPKLTKTGKRSSPKKHLSKTVGSNVASKKSAMQSSMKASSAKKSSGQSSLSRNEAAVIASAPELSNLLQNMKTDLTRYSSPQLPSSSSPVMAVATAPSTCVPSSIPTTTAFTLSKFLLSSNILKSSDDSLDPSAITLDSKADGKVASPVPTANTAQVSDPTPRKRETQILIHTRDSSVPVSFPVTITMASKVLKTTAPLMKVAGGGQIGPTFTYDPKAKPTPGQAGILHVLQTTPSVLAPHVHTPTLKAGPSPQVKGSATPTSKSPLASVIDMGSDTVQMKETPPSTSAPGTVSIDLGQLSASNNLGQLSASNNIVMKFGAPSKISLMPTLKPASSSSSSSSSSLLAADKRDVTVASLLGESKACVTSSTAASSVLTKPQSLAVPVHASGKAADKNLTILSGSNLLSTLTTNTGLITLKLSSPAASTGLALATTTTTSSKASGAKEGSEGILKALSGITAPKTVTAMTFNPSNSAAVSGVKPSQPLLSQFLLQDHKEEKKAQPKAGGATVPVVLTALSKASAMPAAPSAGQVIFRTTSASKELASPKTVYEARAEPLGQVSSLLESSPVTVDQPKGTANTSTTDWSADKVVTKPQPSSSPSSHAQPPTPRASKSTVASYTPTTKQVLPTVASTRTRRIKTPKQYDL